MMEMRIMLMMRMRKSLLVSPRLSGWFTNSGGLIAISSGLLPRHTWSPVITKRIGYRWGEYTIKIMQ